MTIERAAAGSSHLQRRVLQAGIILLTALLLVSQPGLALERVEAETFGKTDFVFPDGIRGEGPHLIFLSMGTDQKNGTYQGDLLLAWHAELESAGLIPAQATPWHFAVMQSPPRMVRGLIRRGIASSYDGILPPEQGAVLFVDNLESFAASTGVPLDGEPAVLVWNGKETSLMVRGPMTPEAVAGLAAALGGGN